MTDYIDRGALKEYLYGGKFQEGCTGCDEPGEGCPECIADYFDVFHADDAPERTRWVAVEEHIPKNRYLLCTDGDAVYVAMLALDETWRSPNWGLCRHPTHWMLLPKPPKIFV